MLAKLVIFYFYVVLDFSFSLFITLVKLLLGENVDVNSLRNWWHAMAELWGHTENECYL
jgi:hypothetical protein